MSKPELNKKKLKEFGSFILENILTLTIIVIGLVVYSKSQPGAPPVDQSLVLIFGLLSTLVISDYITRLKYLNKFRGDLDKLLQLSLNTKSIFVDNIPFKEELENSNEAFILANTGYKTIGANDESCERFLNKGGKLNIVIMSAEEDSAATEMAAAKSPKDYGADYYRYRIKNTLKELANAKKQSGNGQLSVKTIDITPSYGLYIFQPESVNARMYVRLFAHFDSLNKSPNIFITKNVYPELFAYYLRQYKLITEHSKDFDLSSINLAT